MAGLTIETACIGIAGGHIQSFNSQGAIPIQKGDVRATDMEAALAAARAVPIPEGQQILHVLPQYFVIDSQEKIHDPLGMHGIRLAVQAHIITGAIASVQNLISCIQQLGITVTEVVLEQIASAHAILSDDEKKLGVGILDIGGGTSDLAIYQEGSIRHTMVLPIAGNHFTQDLAIGLRTTLHDAERIKKEYGIVCMQSAEHDTIIEIDCVQGHEKQLIHTLDILPIIEPRAYELISLIHDEIITRHLRNFMRTGLVLTGGGALLKGLDIVAEKIIKVPIRIGQPHASFCIPASLENPIYATSYGLLLFALKQQERIHTIHHEQPIHKRIFQTMKSWVLDFF
jgi:cell division protein FtsA